MKSGIGFLLGLCLFAFATSAHAQAPRTWVSGVGDDFNDCTRTAPCKTFAGALVKTTVGGEISVFDAGDFGNVFITKSITIDGGATLAGIFADLTDGIVVNITDPDDPGVVILRGLSIKGGGTGLNGIRYLAGSKLIVEHCKIYGFTGHGIHMSAPGSLIVTNTILTGDTASPGSNGIDVVNAASLHIEDCTIQGFSSSGLVVENSASGIQTFVKGTVMRNNSSNVIAAGKAVLENCRFERNIIGIMVSQAAKATLHNCVVAGNSTFGLYCHDPSSQAMVDGSQVFNNLVGIQVDAIADLSAGPTAQVRVTNSNITNNTTGLSAPGTGRRRGEILSRTSSGVVTNTVENNGTDGAFTGTYSAK